MFRHTIYLDVESNADDLMAGLSTKALKANLAEVLVAEMKTRAQALVEELIRRGIDMAATGSTITAEQTLEGDRYSVRIVFGAGAKPTLIERAKSLFKRH